MGENAAETVREIEAVRGDLEGKVRVLERRLPTAAVWVKRAVGIAVGGGAGSTVLWFVARRLRNRRSPQKKAKPGTTTVELALPDIHISDEARPWLYGAAAIWVAIRLMEVRETRRMNKLMAKSAAA
jgi:hypothetical protein